METFPLDIFTHIVEELESNQDHKTLRSLSACCRHISPLCQRRLFHAIRLKIWPNILPKLSRLASALETSPHLGSYVRSVTISFQSAMEQKLAPIYSALTFVLSKVHRLEKVDLYWNWHGIGDWTALTSNTACHQFCAEIHRIVQTQHLLHLGIRYINHFPLGLVTTRARVLDLAEVDCHCFNIDVIESLPTVESSTEPSQYPVIRNFVLGGIVWPRILSEIDVNGQTLLHTSPSVPPFDFSQVNRLSVQWDCERDRLQTEKLLGNMRAVHSLDLKVNLEVGFERLSKMISGALLSTMTRLSVEIAYPFRPIEELPNPFESFCKELSALPPSNALQTLSIRISFDTTVIDEVNSHCIKPLALILTQQGFPRLRQARLECNIHLLNFQNTAAFDDLVGMDLSGRYVTDFMNYSSMDSLKFSCLVTVV